MRISTLWLTLLWCAMRKIPIKSKLTLARKKKEVDAQEHLVKQVLKYVEQLSKRYPRANIVCIIQSALSDKFLANSVRHATNVQFGLILCEMKSWGWSWRKMLTPPPPSKIWKSSALGTLWASWRAFRKPTNAVFSPVPKWRSCRRWTRPSGKVIQQTS